MNKYNYFQTWELQLITRFLFKETPLIFHKNKIALANCDSRVNQLQEILFHISHLYFEQDKSLFKCSNYSEDQIKIELNEINKIDLKYIQKHLKKYITAFRKDNLKDYEQHTSFNNQLTNFCKLINQNYNLRDFKLNEWKYLPIILYGYFNKLIKITDIYISLPSDKENEEENIVIQDLVGESLDIPIFKDDFLEFYCNLDITKFAKKHLPKEGKYPNQQKKMLKYINEQILSGKTELSIFDFEPFLKKSDFLDDSIKKPNLTKAISRLNKHYKINENTDDSLLYLIDKAGTYKISETYINKIEQNSF